MSNTEKNTVIQAPQDEFMSLAMKADTVVAQQQLVKDVIRKVMKKDVHFGVVPGTTKPTLYKPGAEVLNLTFRLAPDYVTETIFDGKHMTVRSKCSLTHIPSGKVFGSGEAICSTKEKKYRIRKDGGKIVENANLEDCWNTVLKMGNKRALIAAVLNVTACSDEFTQDMGDDQEPLVVVDTEATVKEAPKQEEKKPEEAVKLVEDWVDESIIEIEELKLPSGSPAWQLVGSVNTYRTSNSAVAKAAREVMQTKGRILIKFSVNGKGTKVVTGMKESANG